jgi:hypothetical protein
MPNVASNQNVHDVVGKHLLAGLKGKPGPFIPPQEYTMLTKKAKDYFAKSAPESYGENWSGWNDQYAP